MAIGKRTNVAVWDERRNTSRVFQGEPDALPRALAALKTVDPAQRRWIEDGYPTLTEDEHVARFGETWKASRAKKGAASDTAQA